MISRLATILIGLIGGIAVGTQTPINGAIGARLGPISSSFIVHFSGMVISGLVLLLRGGEKIREWYRLPWYMLFAGVFGLILYLSINVTIPRLGSTLAITLIVAGQLLAGVLIDHFGWLGVDVHPISLMRIGGVLLLLAGAYMVAR